MDAFAELSAMRKRGTRPEGPIVVTHSAQIAAYYRDPNRGMYVVQLGKGELWNALAGLDVLLIDWKTEPRHASTAQEILAVRPRQFLTSIWWTERNERKAKTAVILEAA